MAPTRMTTSKGMRFFVLTGTTLSYYISEGAGFGAELKGTIKIKPGTTAEVREGECWRQSCWALLPP